MNSFAFRAAVAAAMVTSACVSDPISVPDQGVTPVESLSEQLEAPSDAHCTAENLRASYVDDDSQDRGRIRIAFDGDASGANAVVEVEGAMPVEARIEQGNELLSSAFVQEAQGLTDGKVAVNVRVTLDCGAALENVFFFEDPVKRCATPELSSISGHEAEFYECAERWVSGGQGCGEKGYLLGYGARYARAFYFDTRPRMSRRGKEWLDRVLVCLQHDLHEAITMDTARDVIRRTAFDQHPHCYATSGFCTLPLRDVLEVPATIDGKDLLSKDGLRQLAAMVPACGEQYRLGLDKLLHPH
jgi:hypothetical protein